MSSSAIYADSFAMYRNSENINKAIQNKINNIAENELLFGSVNYSGSYDTILKNYSDSAGESTNGTSNDANGTTQGETSSGGAGTNIDDLYNNVQSSEQTSDSTATEEQMAQLRAAYEQVENEQGWLGKAWNGVKNFFGHGNGSNAVEEALSQAENGEISYQEAVEKLHNYSQKQDSFVEIFSNVASGLAVVAGVIAAPFSFGASLALGAGIGAAVKVGIKASDKATNDVAGDYSVKDGLKDTVTGAVGGVVTAATAGIGSAGMVAAKEGGKVLIGETIKQGAIAGAKAGAISGGVMGATNYTADAVFDGDEFNVGGLLGSTATGAFGGALVGGTVGAATSGIGAYRANASGNANAANAVTNNADDAVTAAANNADDAANAAASTGNANAANAVTNNADDAVTAAANNADDAANTSAAIADKAKGFINSAKQKVVELYNSGMQAKNMSPGDIRRTLTGKTNATYQEFKTAYEAMKQTSEYKTNLAFRTFLEDLFQVGSSENF